MSIVVTAVYILRAIGQIAMGPVKAEFATIKDASFYREGSSHIIIIRNLPDWRGPFLVE
jgi:hypothetical protein